jgi:hypothetical protein
MKTLRPLTLGLAAVLSAAALTAVETGRFEEIRRLVAPEARQGVAADAQYLYAIGNHALGKYRKDTGGKVAGWECPEGQPLTHVNAAIVHDGQLYGAHSNYPGVPHRSSVEVWDPATLTHLRSVDLGETDGSLTWIDRRDGRWLACFVHYGQRGGVPGRGPEQTRLVELDDDWREVRRWKFPPAVLAQIAQRGYSFSGGAIGPDGNLYVTGHDEPQLYVLKFVDASQTLDWIATIPVPAEGQAFSWDPVERGVVHLILKRTREIITGRVHLPWPTPGATGS